MMVFFESKFECWQAEEKLPTLDMQIDSAHASMEQFQTTTPDRWRVMEKAGKSGRSVALDALVDA